jgi:hypothetical protein
MPLSACRAECALDGKLRVFRLFSRRVDELKKTLSILPMDSIVTELIIFDSDGVLVDSEKIALTVLARAASEEGATIGVDEAIRLFRGVKIADCVRATAYEKTSSPMSGEQPR